MWPDAPAHLFASLGAQGNCTFMIPRLSLMLVSVFGAWGGSPEETMIRTCGHSCRSSRSSISSD